MFVTHKEIDGVKQKP